MKRSVSRKMVSSHKKRNKKSGLEKKVEKFLKENGVEFHRQYKVSRCRVDLYFPATNTLCEIAGCYWHGCRKCFPNGNDHSGRNVKDGRRYAVFLNMGYQLMVVWEHDIEKNWDKVAENLLKVGYVKLPRTT